MCASTSSSAPAPPRPGLRLDPDGVACDEPPPTRPPPTNAPPATAAPVASNVLRSICPSPFACRGISCLFSFAHNAEAVAAAPARLALCSKRFMPLCSNPAPRPRSSRRANFSSREWLQSQVVGRGTGPTSIPATRARAARRRRSAAVWPETCGRVGCAMSCARTGSTVAASMLVAARPGVVLVPADSYCHSPAGVRSAPRTLHEVSFSALA